MLFSMPLGRDGPSVDVCTLPTAERPLRIAEFAALFATALRRLDRVDDRRLRLTLAGDDRVAAATRDLTARESECCAPSPPPGSRWPSPCWDGAPSHFHERLLLSALDVSSGGLAAVLDGLEVPEATLRVALDGLAD
jgi:hypothetical protein